MARTHAEYLTSAAAPAGFPPEDRPEIAFTGRSNVGKSSLLNSLVGAKGLARTSGTPGRTQLLNWFAVDSPQGESLYFVDFPGYGYAKVPKNLREAFGPLVDGYLEARKALRLVVVIIDIRRGAEEDEDLYVRWLAEHGRATQVVLTKADKLPKSKRIPAAQATQRALGLRRSPLLYSALTGDGRDELWRAIGNSV
jgi:GTP-binding protein